MKSIAEKIFQKSCQSIVLWWGGSFIMELLTFLHFNFLGLLGFIDFSEIVQILTIIAAPGLNL